MNITFDPAKDGVNRAKHGVSLVEASQLDWGNALVSQDERRAYGEPRQVALAPMWPATCGSWCSRTGRKAGE